MTYQWNMSAFQVGRSKFLFHSTHIPYNIISYEVLYCICLLVTKNAWYCAICWCAALKEQGKAGSTLGGKYSDRAEYDQNTKAGYCQNDTRMVTFCWCPVFAETLTGYWLGILSFFQHSTQLGYCDLTQCCRNRAHRPDVRNVETRDYSFFQSQYWQSLSISFTTSNLETR